MDPKWIVCQLGAREHYAIPGALHGRGILSALYTDVWSAPLLGCIPSPWAVSTRIRGRFRKDLSKARVRHYTARALSRESAARLFRRGESAWARTIARNQWFQTCVLDTLQEELDGGADGRGARIATYSYASKEILKCGRDSGCTTVLCQIDPGPVEQQIVESAVRDNCALNPKWEPAPSSYWSDWREECAVADRIVVNSEWSKRALSSAGIEREDQRGSTDV